MPTDQQIEQQRRHEEELMAAQLAAGIAAQMKQINSMSASSTPLSKGPMVNPRNILKTPPGIGARVQQAPQGRVEDSLAPRVATIPMPAGIDAAEIIPPEMRKAGSPVQPKVVPVAAPPTAGQLELDFDRQTVLNDVYNRLDVLNSKIDAVLSILTKIAPNAATISRPTDVQIAGTPVDADKKKSDA